MSASKTGVRKKPQDLRQFVAREFATTQKVMDEMNSIFGSGILAVLVMLCLVIAFWIVIWPRLKEEKNGSSSLADKYENMFAFVTIMIPTFGGFPFALLSWVATVGDGWVRGVREILKPDCVLALNQVLGHAETELLLGVSLAKTGLGFQILNIVMTGPKVFGVIAWVVVSMLLARF